MLKTLNNINKKNCRFKYIISNLPKIVSTKGIYATVIEKLKYEKVMKIILGILLLFLAWGFSLLLLSSVLVQIVYTCKRRSINFCSEIPFTKNPHHTETSQLICFVNQLTRFYTLQVLTGRYFRIDFRLLLTVMSHYQMAYKSNYSDLFHNKLKF